MTTEMEHIEKSKKHYIENWTNLIKELSLNSQSVAIGIFNTEGLLLDANLPMCYFLGTNKKDLDPKNQFINPLFPSFLVEKKEGLIFDGFMTIGDYNDISYVLQTKVYHKNDQILIFSDADVPQLFEDNKKMSVLNQEVNNLQRQIIKEKKNLQETLAELNQRTIELEKLNTRLSELNIEKNRYIGMVAHDLRNPIGIAESFSYLLREEINNIPKNKLMEYLDIICNRCTFSLDLIRNFLDISKIEAGIFDVKLTRQEYCSFVKESIKNDEILANNKSQKIIVKTTQKSIILNFDKNKIQQVLNNLLSNAIKYSLPNTVITIDISLFDNLLVTKIIDQGQGIPKNELPNLFQAYQTTSVKATANEKSTGLGLVIVKKIIEAHQGTIHVQSKLGKGSTFYFKIPMKI